MDDFLGRRDFFQGIASTAMLLMTPGVFSCFSGGGKTGFLYDDIYLEHDTGAGHPEKPGRLAAINNRITGKNIYRDLLLLESSDALAEDICLVHSEEYVETVKRECEEGRRSLSTGDTVICMESYSVAIKAAGGIIKTVDSIFNGIIKNAFCAVRPPGHHATPNRGMGFCVFNNAAIAARYAQEKHGAERVLIADWDVHHGNGTQDTFYADASVFFFSSHQSPLYPGTGSLNETGSGGGEGYTMNRPFPEGTGDDEITEVFRDDLLPAAKEFKPDFVIISAGFDSRIDDPLGGFDVTDDGFRELTRIMMEIADINADGRLISVLEGGYNLEGIANAASAHVEELVKT